MILQQVASQGTFEFLQECEGINACVIFSKKKPLYISFFSGSGIWIVWFGLCSSVPVVGW